MVDTYLQDFDANQNIKINKGNQDGCMYPLLARNLLGSFCLPGAGTARGRFPND
jgi:hypothetical protein